MIPVQDGAYEYYNSTANLYRKSSKNWCHRVFTLLIVLTLGACCGYLLKSVLVSVNECTTKTTTIETNLTNVSTKTYDDNNVLVIWSPKSSVTTSKALMTDFEGNVKQIQWTTGDDATAFTKCSVLFEDKMYFLG